MKLYRLALPLGGTTRPVATTWTERVKCEACEVVRHEPMAAPPLYEIRISNRPKRPGLYLSNQPGRATLMREALYEALRERGLDAGLVVHPAKIENYASSYCLLAPRVRLILDLRGQEGPFVRCEVCGGNSFGHPGLERVFFPPAEEVHWYDTNVVRDPGVVLAVSEAVKDFLTSAEGVKLVAPSKVLPLPEFELLEFSTSPRD